MCEALPDCGSRPKNVQLAIVGVNPRAGDFVVDCSASVLLPAAAAVYTFTFNSFRQTNSRAREFRLEDRESLLEPHHVRSLGLVQVA